MTPVAALQHQLNGFCSANFIQKDKPVSSPSMCTWTVEPSQELKCCACALALLMIALYSVSTVLMTAPIIRRAASIYLNMYSSAQVKIAVQVDTQ